jgi:hypothetical protein
MEYIPELMVILFGAGVLYALAPVDSDLDNDGDTEAMAPSRSETFDGTDCDLLLESRDARLPFDPAEKEGPRRG